MRYEIFDDVLDLAEKVSIHLKNKIKLKIEQNKNDSIYQIIVIHPVNKILCVMTLKCPTAESYNEWSE